MPVSVEGGFVGDDACADCHPGEADAHTGTNHALTLRKMDRDTLDGQAPPAGSIAGTGYTIVEENGRYAISATEYPDRIAWFDLAIGSGKTGMTYVSVSKDVLSEAEMSYFPPFGTWYRTPGHKEKPAYMLGQAYTGEFPKKCIGCHAVTFPSETLKLDEKLMGVGCEACHGAGAAHIAAVHSGRSKDLKMVRLAEITPKAQNDLCGKCHLPFQQGHGATGENQETHRFQPLGIERSACFIKSGGNVSCVTCHDPHTNASTDKAQYEAVCLSCHSQEPATVAVWVKKRVQGRICPVNARTDCTSCHMPPRRIFKDSNVPTFLADHYIKVYEPKLLKSLLMDWDRLKPPARRAAAAK